MVLVAALLAGVFIASHVAVVGRGFHNTDDWDHLEVASDVLAGREGAIRDLLIGSDVRLLRAAPRLLWVAELAAYGLDARRYYVTNLLLSVCGVLGVFALTLRGGRVGGTPAGLLGASAAALLFGLNPATQQGVYYLSGRDDLVALAGVVWACVV